MKDFLKQMFSAKSGQTSSKRVMGVLIIISVVSMYIYCGIVNKETPSLSGELLLTATALLGVDSVASAFRKDSKSEHND